jgi:hypothetical protein
MNAAAWFGAAVFFALGVEPAIFSHEVHGLLQKSFPYLSGMIEQAARERFFYFNLGCGGVALLHLTAEWLYQGHPARKYSARLLAALLALVLLSGGLLQPHLKRLHGASLLSPSVAERQTAKQWLGVWHAVSVTSDCLLIAGLGVYFWRLANPPDTLRFLSAGKFRS